MYHFIKWALARLGLDLRPLRNVERKLIGAEIRRRHTQSGGERGEIVSNHIDGQRVSFFVCNEADVIQKSHKRGRFYEEEELAIIKTHFKGGTFVDVGSNIGNHSIFAAKFMNASRIVAIEPNPAAYLILRVNIALNDLAHIVTHHAVGLADKPGRATFQTFQDNLGGTRLDTSSGGGEFQVVTGDSLLEGVQVDFLKIDTEGLEIQVLHGLASTIARCRPPMFIELDQSNAPYFYMWLNDWNYKVTARYTRYPGAENFLIIPTSGNSL